MEDLKMRLKRISEKFGVEITPDNVERVQKETWDRYYKLTGKK